MNDFIDEDEAPELGDEWFKSAHQYHGMVLTKEGHGTPITIAELREEQENVRNDNEGNNEI